ncbi:MAG: hypothetical protein LBS99_04335 [Clostridiales bacterium]|jgi:hypothetical protein|nr:hypothetical protein [Clostridiales bacterium]
MKRIIALTLAAALFLAVCIGCAPQAAGEQFIYYGDYGAAGDGVTDDFEAILKTHEAANAAGVSVRADAGATYYIGGADKTVKVRTNTDWGDAKFIIDDVDAENRNAWVFNVSSALSSSPVKTVETLKKNQEKLNLSLPYNSLIVATDDTTKRYIREGVNANDGASQTDVFVVDKSGNVDPDAPILWDFDNISSMTAYPIDTKPLTVKGGFFTTIANRGQANEGYFARGIRVTRSNTLLTGIYHGVEGEGDHGSPYTGFISAANCADVTVADCMLTGHRVYLNVKPTGTAQQGTYDMNANRAVNLTVENCAQTNDINNSFWWGIFTSNYSKNIVFDGVTFSRFDAHQGVANATVRNSVLGWQGISIIGSGTLLVENTEVRAANFLNLRNDYGSTWEGELIVNGCRYVPNNGGTSDPVLITGSNGGQHNFGYDCYMPRTIAIDGLVIEDTNTLSGYRGPKLFANFNAANTGAAYVEKYPYTVTEEVLIRNLTVMSGKAYTVSANTYMFRNVIVTEIA